MKKMILFILLFSSYVNAQTIEIKGLNYSIKSRDSINKGEYNTYSTTGEISLKYSFLKFKDFNQSLFIEGSYFPLQIQNSKNSFSSINIGYKSNFLPNLLLEPMIGVKEVPYFYTSNNSVYLDKETVPYFKFHGHLALWKISDTNIIGDGFILYGIKTKELRLNEVGIGLSTGFKYSEKYHRIGYRIEHQSSYDNIESNSIFRHVFYYKINF